MKKEQNIAYGKNGLRDKYNYFILFYFALSCRQTDRRKTQGRYIVIKNLSQGNSTFSFSADKTVRGE